MRRNTTKGFTLLEILIVVAVMAILAAILFAVVGRARENARRAVCLNNLKQLALGMQQYVQDYDGRFPPDTFRSSEAFLPYLKSKKLFQCPSASSSKNLAENHYAITGWIYDVDLKAKKVSVKHESLLVDTTTTVLFYEVTGHEEEVKASCLKNKMHVTHFNGSNYAFVDGHVKWRNSLQAAEAFCSSPLAKSFGSKP